MDERRLDEPPARRAPGEQGAAGEQATQARTEDRSLAGLLRELTKESSALVRGEIALARAELEEKAHEARGALVSLSVGGLVLFAGLLCLVGCAAIALAQIWPAWLAALVVGLAVTGAGVALVARGRAALKGARLAPRRTLASLQQTKLFARERAT